MFYMKRKFKKVAFLILACFVCGSTWLFTKNLIKYIEVSDNSFTAKESCPACYGVNICPHYETNQLKLQGWSSYSSLQLFNQKNVFFGQFGFEKVVVKKLAHNDELIEVDRKLCDKTGSPENCNVTIAVKMLTERLDNAMKISMANDTIDIFESDLFKCPSKRLLDLMIQRCILEAGTEHMDLNIAKQYLIYSGIVNPEPLMLQMFPFSEGWPFPRLIGACGRTIVVEYAGKMLSHYEDAPWRKRVDIAIQLLKLAQQLTENSLDFALYMTDVNMHNFAIDSEGMLRLIDAENIIVVDKQKVRKEKPLGWDEPYINYGLGCHDCLSFSPQDLCAHEYSDHNYYAVCRGILSPKSYYSKKGFLHGIPQLRQGTKLHDILQKCAFPTSDMERLEVVPQLINLLEALLY